MKRIKRLNMNEILLSLYLVEKKIENTKIFNIYSDGNFVDGSMFFNKINVFIRGLKQNISQC